jgi:hypothetical protein
MKMVRIALMLFFMFCVTSSLADEKMTKGTPLAFIPVGTYEFEPVLEGVAVIYDFVIENRGDALLKIINVKPSCGCTTVSYTREIAPGGSGKIGTRLNTTGYGGRIVRKRISVKSNDPNRTEFQLTITGNVDRLAQITPKMAFLSGRAGDAIKTEITIIPENKYPFKILGVRAEKGEHISYDLKEIKVSGVTQYLLTVVNLQKTKGRYSDVIYLETDHFSRPYIRIKISGKIT